MFKCNFFLWIFSIITPVFSVTWSSEIILICWFAAQETFLIIINVENSCADEYFCGNWYILFFRIHRWKESSKQQHLFVIKICWNIINVFTVTDEQLNASSMNKSFKFFQQKKSHWPQTFEWLSGSYSFILLMQL